MKKYLLLFLLFSAQQVSAQIVTAMPYKISVQTIAPNSQMFYDYFDVPGKLLLTLNRLLPPGDNSFTDIWLSGRLDGDNGVHIYTSENYNPATLIHSDETTPVKILTGNDLIDCFQQSVVLVESPNNSYTKNDLHTKALPVGKYKFCFSVRGQIVGNVQTISYEVCSFEFTVAPTTEPPMLIAPQCGVYLSPMTPQQIIFTWLPTFSMQSISYTFKMVELLPGQNEQQAIDASSAPVYFEEQNIMSTTLVYSLNHPTLNEGKTYAWRVTAFSADGSLLKNNGKSIVCTFVYSPPLMLQESANTLTNTGAIHLEYPLDKSLLKKFSNGYEFKWSGKATDGYYLNFAEMKDNETPVEAMQRATKEAKIITETGKEISDGGLIYHMSNDQQKLTPGKFYAWRVMNQYNVVSVETWQLKIPVLFEDTVKVKQFDFNGFKVYVESVTTPGINSFGGTGFLYLWNDANGPKVKVVFTSLVLKNQSFTPNGGATNWKCSHGTLDGDIINWKKFPLKNAEGAGGNFMLTGTKIHFKAYETTQLNEIGNAYIFKSTTETKSQMLAFLKWGTELKYVGPKNTSVGSDGDGAPSSYSLNTAIVIQTEANYIDITPDKKLSGFLTKTKAASYELKYPENFLLYLSGVQFDFNDNYVTCGISGSVTVPDGRDDLDKDLKIEFTWKKSFDFGVKIPSFNIPLNIQGFAKGQTANPVTADATFDSVEVYLAPGKGLNIPVFYVTAHLLNQNLKFKFLYAYNQGHGYLCSWGDKTPQEFMLNTFKAKSSYASISVWNSVFQELKISGDMLVPFVNLNGKFNYAVNVYGMYSASIDFDKSAVIYNDLTSGDKLVADVSSANLLDDRVVMDMNFSFSNWNNKNINVKNVVMNQVYVKGSGKAGFQNTNEYWQAAEWQQTGDFSGFVFKAKKMQIFTDNNMVYHTGLWGDIVLEEQTLSSPGGFAVETSFKPFEQRSDDENKMLTASAEPFFSSSANSFIAANNSVNMQPKSVEVVHNSGNLSFSIKVDYYHDDINFGNGFSSSQKVTLNVPVYKEVYSKTLIGKANGFNYWFVQGKYTDGAGIPTGVLDMGAYEFDGRFYYNMYHSTNVNELSDNFYIPNYNVGVGLFALTKVKSTGSNGGVLYATGAVKLEAGSKTATFYCLANMLNAGGVGTNTSLLKGDGVVNWCFSPFYIDGDINVKQNILSIFSAANVYTHLHIDPSNLTVNVTGSAHVDYINVNSNITAGIAMHSNLKCKVSGAFSADLVPLDKSLAFCTIKAGIHVDAALSGDFVLGVPLNISGKGGLSAYAKCGVFGGGVGITGAYSLPSPFCLAAGIGIPYPEPDWCCHCKYCVCGYPCISWSSYTLGARWKSSDSPMFSFNSTCD